ncbi:hypothetical protein CHS0354_024385 [Potamilus streckersoni]|uniref:Uncharacterized protein n=1 Tax=Potamilus streckersoni TaxID=2493646 RepID=A0AAE0W3F4_9BIVA|nr:hypothetical protein CHS0354_024385 [Potamilus streckersoni]
MKSSRRIVAFLFLIAISLLMIRLYYIWTTIAPESSCMPQPRYFTNGSLILNPVRYLIDTCVDEDQCFGWGDRQRAIVTTYLVSLLSGRQFGIYMTNPCALENFLAPNKLNWIVKKDELDSLCTRNFYMYNVHLQHNRQHQMIETADFQTLFPEDVIYFHTAQDYLPSIRRNKLTADKIPWLHRYTLGEAYGYIMKLLFTPNNNTQKTVTELLSKHVKNQTLVCAHVRMGIVGFDTLRTPKSELHVIWDFLHRYNDTNKYKLYVATDMNETKAQAKKLFRDQIFDTVGIIDQMHRSKSCEVFRRVIVEQEILTRCDILMLTQSTMGMIAAFTRNTNNGLYCFYKERVFPCTIETLHELHNIM